MYIYKKAETPSDTKWVKTCNYSGANPCSCISKPLQRLEASVHIWRQNYDVPNRIHSCISNHLSIISWSCNFLSFSSFSFSQGPQYGQSAKLKSPFYFPFITQRTSPINYIVLALHSYTFLVRLACFFVSFCISFNRHYKLWIIPFLSCQVYLEQSHRKQRKSTQHSVNTIFQT